MTDKYGRRACTAGIILGIIGTVFSAIFPAVTYGCSVSGLVLSAKKRREGYDTRAAMALNIVALSLAFANSVLSVVLTAAGFAKKHKDEC